MYLFFFVFFFFNDTATTEIYTLSLHDALPIRAARARDSVQVRLRSPQCTPGSTVIPRTLGRNRKGREPSGSRPRFLPRPPRQGRKGREPDGPTLARPPTASPVSRLQAPLRTASGSADRHSETVSGVTPLRGAGRDRNAANGSAKKEEDTREMARSDQPGCAEGSGGSAICGCANVR